MIKQLEEFLKSDHWLRRYCIFSGGVFYFEPPCISVGLALDLSVCLSVSVFLSIAHSVCVSLSLWCIGGYTRVYGIYQPPGFFDSVYSPQRS